MGMTVKGKHLGVLIATALMAGVTAVNAADPPTIKSLLKPAVFQKIIEDQEVMVNARLAEVAGESGNSTLRKYSYYGAMKVHASLKRTRAALTDYPLYGRIIPFVDQAEYNASTQTLKVGGGYLGFRLESTVRFSQKGERWLGYRIIGGHFEGLTGDMIFETLGEKGTLVLFRGELTGRQWPPRWIIERGAEFVF